MLQGRVDVADPLALAGALAEAARAIDDQRSLDDTFAAIALQAKASLDGFDGVSVSIRHGKGQIETVAATDQMVWDLDGVQYQLHEGPCVTAMDNGDDVWAEHLHHEPRWPRYLPHAVAAGVRSQLGVHIRRHQKAVAGLNLYSTSRDTIDPTDLRVAQLFATHAGMALGHARDLHSLSEALMSRGLIAKAVGIVMMKYDLSEDRAWEYLRRVSMTSNVKVRELAREIVEGP